jgi:hypothetical protein
MNHHRSGAGGSAAAPMCVDWGSTIVRVAGISTRELEEETCGFGGSHHAGGHDDAKHVVVSYKKGIEISVGNHLCGVIPNRESFSYKYLIGKKFDEARIIVTSCRKIPCVEK